MPSDTKTSTAKEEGFSHRLFESKYVLIYLRGIIYFIMLLGVLKSISRVRNFGLGLTNKRQNHEHLYQLKLFRLINIQGEGH